MSRNASVGTLKPEDAAPLLGMDKNTLTKALKEGFMSDIGTAFKTGVGNECYSFIIYKFQVFTRLGYDVNLSVEEVMEQIGKGKPPWIDQSKVSAHIKKDASTLESIASKLNRNS